MTIPRLSGYFSATPSRLSGAARLLDLAGVFDQYNFAESPGASDFRGIWSDWTATGSALVYAVREFERDPERTGMESTQGPRPGPPE